MSGAISLLPLYAFMVWTGTSHLHGTFLLHKHMCVLRHCEQKMPVRSSGVPGGGGGSNPPSPKIPKALQNRVKLNPIVKTAKNCRI